MPTNQQNDLKAISDFIQEYGFKKSNFHRRLNRLGYKSFGHMLTQGEENGLCKVFGFALPYPDVEIIYPPPL